MSDASQERAAASLRTHLARMIDPRAPRDTQMRLTLRGVGLCTSGRPPRAPRTNDER